MLSSSSLSIFHIVEYLIIVIIELRTHSEVPCTVCYGDSKVCFYTVINKSLLNLEPLIPIGRLTVTLAFRITSSNVALT